MIGVEIPVGDTFALVDRRDYKRVAQHRWFLRRDKHTNYALANIYVDGVRKKIQMHRFILELPPSTPWVDHINHDGLDNRRRNLRTVTPSENHMNRRTNYGTSGFKGVYFDRRSGLWVAQITANGKQQRIGQYATEEEAARARDRRAKQLHGEHALLNFKNPGREPRPVVLRPSRPAGSAVVTDMTLDDDRPIRHISPGAMEALRVLERILLQTDEVRS